MDPLLAWLWTPAVLWACCLGLGLLAERICRFTLPNALVAPVGLAAIVAIAMPVYLVLKVGAWLVIAIVLVLAALGIVLARRELRARVRPGWGAVAAAAAYVLYLAPVALSGHATFAGYDFVNDPSLNFIFTDMLEHGGLRVLATEPSTTAGIQLAAANSGYPLGAFALLATLRPLSFAPLAAVYQPAIAAAAAAAAAALFAIARRVGLPRVPAAGAAVLGIGSNLLYVFAQQGDIKEVLTVALLLTSSAVALEGKAAGLPIGSLALAALAAAPMLAVFSGGAAAFVGALAVFLALAVVLEGRFRPSRRWLLGALSGAAVAALVAAPLAASAVRFIRGAGSTFTTAGQVSTTVLGQLLRPLPFGQAAGVWLGADYRLPVTGNLTKFNEVGIALVLGLAAVAVLLELRTRRIGVTLPLATVVAVYLVAAPRLTAYADSKLLVVVSPPLVFAAAVGGWRLIAWRWWLGLPLAALVALGVFLSDARTYNGVRLAPMDRLYALQDAADHAAVLRPKALWMENEWEEYAKYFMRRVHNGMAAESFSPAPVVLRTPQPIFGQYFDLDEQVLSYVTQFGGLVTRRSPSASRPPASFRLAYQNAYYDLWVQDRPVKVLEHLPLQARDAATRVPSCKAVRALARRTRRGQWLIGAVRPVPTMIDPAKLPGPRDWTLEPDGLLAPDTPGSVSAERRMPAGRYDAWIRGSSGRPLDAIVDGRLVGAPKGVNGPGQWLYAGRVTLAAGVHRLELRRPAGTLAPGSGYNGEFGPLVLDPVQPERLERVAPKQAAAQLCGRPLDWIERVTGR
jgi:hypothetical protein